MEAPRLRSGDMMLGAERIRAERALGREPADSIQVEMWEARARSPLEVIEPGAGGELLPEDAFGLSRDLRNTLDNPDYVAADASRDRVQLAHDAGVLELGIDTADTIQARNSVEKMLAHQLAAAHHSSMHITKQLNGCLERMDSAHEPQRETANVQATRLAGAAARMMAAFQGGALALERMRSGGGQQVTVRHVYQQVNVENGGQALVAGKLQSGSGRCDKP